MIGIPTNYAGVNFRSRLEARWASFFNAMGWKWRYEPIDLAGYIPDFVVELPVGTTLVEVKPGLSHPDLVVATEKIERSGWTGRAMVVGVGPDIVLRTDGEPWRWWPSTLAEHEAAWRAAGNDVQWRAPVVIEPSIRSTIRSTAEAAVEAGLASFRAALTAEERDWFDVERPKLIAAIKEASQRAGTAHEARRMTLELVARSRTIADAVRRRQEQAA